MSNHPGELDALPLADLLDPDSAATKLELRHALGLAWGEVLRLRGEVTTDPAGDCPVDADGMPVVRTVGDLTARHIGRRVRVETDRTLPDSVRVLSEIATRSNMLARLTLDVIDHPEWFLMAWFDHDTPCEVIG